MLRRRMLLALAAALFALSPALAPSAASALTDTISPVLWYFSPSPAVVDVGTADALVAYHIDLSDDLTGIDTAASFVELRSPSGVLADVAEPLTLVSGDSAGGTAEYTFTLRIPRGSESGVWTPRGLFYDKAGNLHTVSTSDLLGYGRTKTVVVTNLAGGVDVVDARVVGMSPMSAVVGHPVTLSAGAVDSNGHAIVGYQWFSSVDGYLGATSGPSLVTASLSAGSHIISVRAQCAEGVWSSTADSLEALIVAPAISDGAAPLTSSDALSSYVGTATITLTAFDLFGSGVAHTYYAIDGAAPLEGTSVVVSAPGTHQVTFWSVDRAGNAEAPTTVTITVLAVKTRAVLTTPSAPTSVRRGSGFTVSGRVAPAHTPGAPLVTLRFYRYESGRYVLRKTVTAAAKAYSASQSSYSVRLSLPYRGKWRVRATHSDALHLTSRSSYRYISVR